MGSSALLVILQNTQVQRLWHGAPLSVRANAGLCVLFVDFCRKCGRTNKWSQISVEAGMQVDRDMVSRSQSF
jgi:hypothetical protein